jgi:hypothetical protein
MDAQQAVDTFYWANGDCCAGCDWWRHVNSTFGECRRSAPVAGETRYAMIGMSNLSASAEPGHVFTPRGHRCGGFKDEFDWRSLSLSYLAKIGAKLDGRG